jgi:hypothetical protein
VCIIWDEQRRMTLTRTVYIYIFACTHKYIYSWAFVTFWNNLGRFSSALKANAPQKQHEWRRSHPHNHSAQNRDHAEDSRDTVIMKAAYKTGHETVRSCLLSTCTILCTYRHNCSLFSPDCEKRNRNIENPQFFTVRHCFISSPDTVRGAGRNASWVLNTHHTNPWWWRQTFSETSGASSTLTQLIAREGLVV